MRERVTSFYLFFFLVAKTQKLRKLYSYFTYYSQNHVFPFFYGLSNVKQNRKERNSADQNSFFHYKCN